MMAWKVIVRSITLVAAICCLASLAVEEAEGQTVTVSPSSKRLSFGVPGTVEGVQSAPQAITVSVGGSGTATISGINIAGSSDFSQTNTCANPITAPGSCVINVIYTANADAGTLESANLTFDATGSDGFSFALTGALGAIRLFDPINVATSNPSATFGSMVTLGSTTLNLSCPAGATAKISSRPDGTGNIVLDNYVTLSVNGEAVAGSGPPAGNVCTGGVSDNNGSLVQQDCFTQAYRNAAGNFGANGENPDDFANGEGAWGVPPIAVNIGSNSDSATTPTAAFSELDAGVVYAGSTLFLATSCSLTNANTGTETANPPNQQPVQTLTFDAVPDHLDQYGFDYSFVNPNAITNFNSTPLVTNTSLSPSGDYPGKVLGTPFQNTFCIPLNSLNGSCAQKTQVCTPSGGGTATGANCPQTTGGDSFLFSSTFDPSVAANTLLPGFGFLEFNDHGGCPLEGPESGKPCPQNGLVFFTGPGELRSGTGKAASNSSYVIVEGITPPTTAVNITPFFPTGLASGWTNGNPSATFTSTPGPTTPTIAPIQFLEYGVNNQTSPGVPGLPPTFPLPFPGNGTFAADTFTTPATCPSTYPATAPSVTTGPVSLATQFPNAHFNTDGSVNLLNYSTTDCADTHELQFSFDGTKWATSFKSITLMSDTVPPGITLTTPPVSGGSYSANQKVKASYGCTDTESGVATCAGPVANGANIDTTPNGTSTTKSFTVNSKDNVGNMAAAVTGSYTVTCHYAAVTLSPTTVKRGSFINVTASVIDCVNTPQNVKVQFTLSGPLGKNCGNSSTVMFTTPTFTIRSGTSSSITFPFLIAKTACTGPYTVTTTTLQGSPATSIDSVSSTLTVTN
jgi:hypothetical protein